MVAPEKFVEVIKKNNMGPFIGVPCSILAPLLGYVMNNPAEIEYFNPVNEAHALGLATGFYLATERVSVVLLQNSGFGNIINPLTSLNQIYKIPAFLVITWRGFGGVGTDAPEHDIVGRDLENYLKVFNIPCEILSEDDYQNQIMKLRYIAYNEKIPVAAIIKKNFFDSYDGPVNERENNFKRWEAIEIIKESLNDFIFLSTTGFISRESFSIKDTPDFYMVGSMGLISAIGCSVALMQNRRRIAVLDGDGAILMHLGLIPFIGSCKPKNLFHFILDNEAYASTQNQPTVSPFIEFDKMALSAGYAKAYKVCSGEELKNLLFDIKNSEGPILIWIKVASGNKNGIGRISYAPEGIRDRFMDAIK